jgi:hypothetical protein
MDKNGGPSEGDELTHETVVCRNNGKEEDQ